jgi:predicted outer membrane repeat protein
MAVTNSSFSGNSATTGGGGICNHGTVTMTNNTLSANKSANGGALYNYRGTLNLLNTILANSPTGFDCFNYLGIIGKNTNNLIETNGKCGTPVISSDPKLGPLANNGGSTLTFALLSGSPAIHKGSTAVCAAAPVNNKDQRGFIRSQDAACDIGAYELMH